MLELLAPLSLRINTMCSLIAWPFFVFIIGAAHIMLSM
uniref:Uncharacterized protein n=1 Tax=Rhizophora mucronata TaxID=61149 RepID=A0A2P2N347_RHIMU